MAIINNNNTSAFETLETYQRIGSAITHHEKGADFDFEHAYLTFMLGDSCYAIASAEISEALSMSRVLSEPTPLPLSSSWVAGLLAVNGRPLAVVDLSVMLKKPAADSSKALRGKTLVVYKGGQVPLGLLVDSVQGVRTFDDKALKETEQVFTPYEVKPFDAIHSSCQLLNMDALLNNIEFNQPEVRHGL